MKKEKLRKSHEPSTPVRQVSTFDMPFFQKRYASLASLAIIAVLGALIYANSFSCSFQFDDSNSIVDRVAIRDLSDWNALWNIGPTRFVAYFTFALNYHFGELNVWGYHLVNLMIHLANACLVYWLTLLLFSTPALQGQAISRDKKLMALIAALMFVSHPLATQSVTYIVQRMASLMTLFYLLSLAFYAKARLTENRTAVQYLLFAGCLISALLALFTKENAFTLPLAIALFELCFLRTKDRSFQIFHYRTALFVALFIGAIIIIVRNYSGSILQSIQPDFFNEYRTITPVNYLLTQFGVIVKYIGLLILPVNQNLDHDIPLSNSLFETRTLLSFVALLSLMGLGIYLFNKQRVLSFGIFWFFLTLSVESSIIPISDLMYEHRTYLPSVGFFIALSSGLYLLLWEKYRSLAVFIFLAIILSNAYLTVQRNKIWKTERTLWSDVVSKSPNKSRAYYNLGILSRNEGKPQEALKYLNKAIELQPNYPGSYILRAAILSQDNFEKALLDFNKAIELDPKDYNTYNSRGAHFQQYNKINEAVQDFSKSLEVNPDFETAWLNRAGAYNKAGKYEEAIADCNKFIAIKPDVPNGFYSRGLNYMSLGKKEQAVADFQKAVELNPKYVEAYVNRGILLRDMNKTEEALQDFQKALDINPGFPIAYFSRGGLWLNQKKYKEAIDDFSKAISLNTSYAKAYFNRGLAHYQINKKDESCKDFQKAFELGFLPAKDMLNQYCR